MDILEILNQLEENQVYIALDGDDLELSFMQDEIPDEIIQLLKAHKASIISYLSALQEKNSIGNIPKVGEQDAYPLSSAQRRMWILSQFEEVSLGYNLPSFFQLNGAYDIAAFKKAILAAIERHEILRTVFRTDENEEVRQHVIPFDQFKFNIGWQDLSHTDHPEQIAQKWIFEDYYKPFDLENGPLLRVNLFQLNAAQYLCYYNLHHIIGDGWSLNILSRDVLTFYQYYTEQLPLSLPPLPIQYKDYAAWQLEQLGTKTFSAHKTYWVNKLSGEIPVLDLPTTKIRPAMRMNNGRLISNYLDENTTACIRAYLKRKGGTLFPFLLASFKVLMYKYTRQEDLIIGSPVAGRDHPELEDQIGVYINTLALRSMVSGAYTFDEFYDIVKAELLEAYAHQAYPFDLLVDELNLNKDFSRSPLFDIMVAMRNSEESNGYLNLEDIDLSNAEYDRPVKVKFDLEIGFKENGNHIGIELMFNTDIYDYSTMLGLIQHFQVLVNQILSESEAKVADLSYLTPSDKSQLAHFNATEVSYDFDRTILSEFKDRVLSAPDRIAVWYETESLSYAALDAYSNQLAHYLQQVHGVGNGDLVGLHLDRSHWMLVSILGVLKSGSAYVPIDMEYPADRIAFIGEDSGFKVCIDQAFLNVFQSEQNNYSAQPPEVEVTGSTPAYAIYTSGSTGRPKGVLNRHESLYNRLLWMREGLGIGESDILLQKTPYTFDVSVWELLMLCVSGSQLVFLPPGGHKDPVLLHGVIERQEVTVIHFVPSMLGMFLEALHADQCKSLRHIVCSGEVLPVQMVAQIQHSLPWVHIHNLYGPTEAAIDVTWADLTHLDTQNSGGSIGKPVANTRIYIVDKDLKPQAVGVAGELLIEGIQVASGYLNRPELTAEKFIQSPFNPNDRVYRTGDLCKWMPNGEIAYLGRLDHQVKIRGNRIELGEIEHQMERSGYVDQAVVLVRELSSGDKTLIGYIKLSPGATEENVYQNLRSNLPPYMLPSRLVRVEAFPMTSSGKVARKQLAERALAESEDSSYSSPANDLEEKIWQIWSKVLEHEDFGTDSNFFRAGGDSILSIRLVSRLNKAFGLNLKLGELYEHSTIAALGRLIESQPGQAEERQGLRSVLEARYAALDYDRGPIEALYPMSDIQRGMVYTTLNNPGSGVYHDQFVYTIPRIGDESKLLEALTQMAERHPTLRTSFALDRYEEPMQVLHRDVDLKGHVRMTDLRSHSPVEQRNHIEQFVSSQRGQLFDFSKAPLWQIDLFTIDETKSIYVLQFHHAILDGWSVALFNTELFNNYQQLVAGNLVSTEPLGCSVKEVVLEERLEKHNTALRNYWAEYLKGYQKLDFFTEEEVYATYRKDLGGEVSTRLRAYTSEENLHHRNIILGAYIYVLRQLSLKEDLVIGQVSNNRPPQEDGDRVLGCFLNTLPMRLRPFDEGVQTWKAYFEAVAELMQELKQHDRLTIYEISKLAGKEKSGENPFFDIIYNYVDFSNSYKHIDARPSAETASEEEDIPSFEQTNTFLDINIWDNAGGNIEFRLLQTRGFKVPTTLATLSGYVEKVLESFLAAPEGVIDPGLILSPADESRRYWHEVLKGDLPVLNLPKQLEGAGMEKHHKQLLYRLSDSAVADIQAYTKQVGGTTFEYLLGVWTVLLYRYTGQEDLLMGVKGLDDASTMVLRARAEGSASFAAHYQVLQQNLIAGRRHDGYGVEKLEQEKGSSGRLLEMQVMEQAGSGSLTYDLELGIEQVHGGGAVQIGLFYNAAVYEEGMMEGMLAHYGHLIKELSGKRETPLGLLAYMGEEERATILEQFNDTTIHYPKNKTLVDLFEEQVKITPDGVAVRDAEADYTYQELHQKVESAAAFLQDLLGEEQGAIGVLMSRSAALPALLLGVLKSGNAYIPIDPTLPADRIQYILQHSGTKILLTDQDLTETLESDAIQVIRCEKLWRNKGFQNTKRPKSTDTAYIIYTSGSTGNPKGVEVGHQSLLNFLLSIQRQPGIKQTDLLYAVTTYSFDISILEFFAPLISGATLYVAKDEILSNSIALLEDLQKVKPTIIQATPSFFQLLFEANWRCDPSLKILCGGDALGTTLASKLAEQAGEVWNMYGPTETTIWSTTKRVTKNSHARSIGKPINNTSIYILDEHLNLLPGGISGKIYIGGDGLAKGYFKNPKLTQERFIPNPFGPGNLYDTGDLGRWLPDGDIEFFGRNDFQVKIRGYRIELEEIENVLLQYSKSIKQVTVALREINTDKSLVAYYTTEAIEPIDKAELKAFLATKLPAYMVPGFFKELEFMPLNANGKIDRKALPQITEDDLLKKEYVQPRSELEEEIIAIIKETLGNTIQRIGILDNFFDLGLDSLMSVKVLYEINSRLKLQLKPLDLFQYPNVQSLVDNVLQSEGQSEPTVLIKPEDIDSIIDIF